MIRRPPRSTLFPTRRSSDLQQRRLARHRSGGHDAAEPGPTQTDERVPHLRRSRGAACQGIRSEEHTSELQSLAYLVCRLLLEKKKTLVPASNVQSLRPAVSS